MKINQSFPVFLLAAALGSIPALSLAQQSTPNQDSGVTQDVKKAGQETAKAAKDTGSGIKHGATKAARATGRGTKKAWKKTKSTTTGAVDGAKQGAKQPE
jgi:hypothetical protein